MNSLPPILLELVRARAGGASFAFEPGPQTYLARVAGGGFRELHFVWDEALLEDLAALDGPRPSAAAAARVGERLRAFLYDTPLQAAEAALGAGATASVHLRAAAAELYALPWELLALRPSGMWLGQLPGVSLSLGWPEAAPTPPLRSPAPEGGRLLFAWSEAGGPVPWRAQQAALIRAFEGVLPFDPAADVLPAATPARLAAALRAARDEGRPFVGLHLLCHGRSGPEGGSLLLDPAGPTDPAALRGLIAPHLDTLRLTLLCACQAGHVGPLGGALGGAALALHRAGAEAVIGARQPLPIDAANVLTEALYTELLQCSNSVESALLAAKRAMQALGAGAGTGGLQLWRHDPGEGDLRPFVLRPYRGLLPFEAASARFFFGRDPERAQLRARVLAASRDEAPRFQVLCGATGSGKSSLMRAGLAPSLAAEGWQVALLRPASGLVAALAAARETLPADARLLALVDPLQEIFTAVSDPVERQALAEALWAASQDRRVVVLCGIRVDYLGRCEEIAVQQGALRLDALVYDEAHRLFLPAPGPEALRAVALDPLRAVGLAFEPGLLDLLIADAGAEPGALPALQHTLDRLWVNREGRLLTHAAYRRLGGLSGALAGWADQVLAALPQEDQQAARRLLVALVSVSEDGQLAARRARRLADLLPADPAARASAQRALDALSGARLVVVGEQGGAVGAELAHEALLRRWEALRRWVEEGAERQRRLEHLVTASREWALHSTDVDTGASYLLRGARLGVAEELAEELAPPAGVLAFLRASRAAEAEVERRRLAELAERERLAREATAAASRARDAALLASAAAWREADPTLAVQLLRAVEAAEQPLDWTREAWGLLEPPLVAARWDPGPAPLPLDSALDPRRPAHLLAIAGRRCLLRAFDGGEEPLFEAEDPLVAAAWSPDGASLIAATAKGALLRWRSGALQEIAAGLPAVTRLRCAPGGRLAIGLRDGRVRVLDRDGEPLATLRGHVGAVLDLDWRADGAALLSASEDGTARLWDLDGGGVDVFRGFEQAVTAARLSPDGGALIAASRDGSLRIWSLQRGAELARRALGAPLSCAAWGPSVLVGDVRGRLTLLSASGELLGTLRGEHGPLAGVAWDGDPLGLSEDGALRRWRLGPGPAPTAFPVGLRRSGALAWSPDEARLAGAAADGLITVLRPAEPTAAPGSLVGHTEAVRALAWSPSGDRLLSAGNDEAVRLWAVAEERALAALRGHDSAATTAAWSPDGEALATGDADGQVILWSARQQREISRIQLDNEATLLAFSPDGGWLLALSADHTTRLCPVHGGEAWRLGQAWTRRAQGAPDQAYTAALWAEDRVVLSARDGSVFAASPATRSCAPIARLAEPATALAAAGGRIALATADGAVSVLEGETRTPLLRPGPPPARQLQLQPGGPLLVGLDTADALWVADRRRPGERVSLPGPARALLMALSPSGGQLAVAGEDQQLRIWPASTRAIRQALEAASGARLSLGQRQRFLGEG